MNIKGIISFYGFHTQDDEIQLEFRVFRYPVFAAIYSKKQGWFRILGKGLMWKQGELRFSERYRYAKYTRIGKWIIEYLP